MQFDLEAIYKDYLELPYEEKVENAIGSIGEISLSLREIGVSEEDRIRFYLNLTALFVAADKTVSASELKLFNDVFESSFDLESFSKFLSGGDDPKFIEQMDFIIDKFSDEAKFAACVYGLIFLSIDGKITAKEKAVFEKILA